MKMLKRLAAVTVLLIFIFCIQQNYTPLRAAENKGTARVLYINSYHPGYKWSDGIEQGIRETFRESGRNIELYVEYLDTQRFPGAGSKRFLADILAGKNRKKIFDLIIVSDNSAFDFIAEFRERLFPGKPVVFCGYNSFRKEYISKIKGITGINEEINFKSTIDMALGIHRGIDTLLFITSDYYSTGRINREKIEKEIIPLYSNKYRIVDIRNPYIDELEERLSKLPENALVFVTGSPLDNLNREFVPSSEYYSRIAASSSVPAYSFWDFIIGTGMTGGNIITGHDQGRKAAELSLRILNGTPAEDVPVIMESPATPIFDYNAMRRFRISEKRLPAGSVIINKPDTFYHRYKVYVNTGMAGFAVLTGLIIMLAYQLGKSRRLGVNLQAESEERCKAVEELRRHKEHLETIVEERAAELRRTYDALRESEELFHRMFDMHSAVMYLLNPETGKFIEMNSAALEFYGFTESDIGSIDVYSVNSISREEINEKMQLTKAGKQKKFEFRHRTAKGEMRDVEIHSSPVPYRGENILFAIVHDITDRKQAELERERLIVELREALARVKTLSGMLPICASCKKIRNDKGYWEQIETYIGEHSGAEFTHGICPDCVEKLYPGMKKKE